jgi:predicted nucleotidyltransferase component of viral defense system
MLSTQGGILTRQFDAYVQIVYLFKVLSARQTVELFHLVFLRALAARGEDKSLYALKGGCNLRFFLGSIRYSEDVDIDASRVAKGTLKNKVDRLLKAPTVVSPLKAHGIEIVEVSAPKQTDTTQRWKIGLRASGTDVPLRTKIEFSRRTSLADTAFEAVHRTVLEPYALTPFSVSHYTATGAIAQKIDALALRSHPQARDVFDLNHLLARPEARSFRITGANREHLPRAIDHAMGISFDEYASQVVVFLDPGQRELFDSRASWGSIQTAVVEHLESLR